MAGIGIWDLINFRISEFFQSFARGQKIWSSSLVYEEMVWVASMLIWIPLILAPSFLTRQSSPSRSLYKCLSSQ